MGPILLGSHRLGRADKVGPEGYPLVGRGDGINAEPKGSVMLEPPQAEPVGDWQHVFSAVRRWNAGTCALDSTDE